jgi:methyltransferase (TIGR00027 family)
LVAAARSFGSHDPDPGVRNPDWLAERLLGPDELALIDEHPLRAALAQDYREASRDMQVFGLTLMMLIRTRFIDDCLLNAVRNGTTQVVILGAGFDSRAYRFHEAMKDMAVFEVDSAATQALKKRRVDAVLGGLPRNVTYVPVNFSVDSLGTVLHEAGCDASKQTFFTWEGVSMYVGEDGVRETLRAMATGSAPGSSVVMDFAAAKMVEQFKQYSDVAAIKQFAVWEEPWLFGVPDGAEREFFAELGFDLAQMFPVYSVETMARYATRKDGTTFGMTPGMPRPAPSQAANAAAMSGRAGSFYSLAELTVR